MEQQLRFFRPSVHALTMASSFSPARWLCALILALAVSACGDKPVPADTVASIVISGVPAEPIPATGTVQLTATPRDAAGNAVNRPVSWSSSNTSVATVGNDPTWQDGGPEGRFRDYWASYSFG